MDIAIIGGGMAGAACGQALLKAGHRVTVFDKGRGPGGRLSTRRAQLGDDETPLRFDHGGQYATARTPAFQKALQGWVAAGQAAPWDGRLVRLGTQGSVQALSVEPRYVGTPGMNALVRAASAGLDVHYAARVTAIEGAPRAWHLMLEDGTQVGPFAAVVCAVPAEQVAPLLGPHAPVFAQAAAAVKSNPCWAVMAVFQNHSDPGFDGAQIAPDAPEGAILSWAAREASKPGRSAVAGAEAWVGHASVAWSRTHLELSPEEAAGLLSASLARLVGSDSPPVWVQAHRWRYAQPENAADLEAVFDPSLSLGVAGDWAQGGRIEAAWQSGHILGTAMAGALA